MKQKKVFVSLLSAGLALSLFTGCSSKPAAKADTAGSAKASAAETARTEEKKEDKKKQQPSRLLKQRQTMKSVKPSRMKKII